MATMRKWLEEAGFNAARGRIVLCWQPSRAFEDRKLNYCNKVPEQRALVTLEHPWLNSEFHDGYGGMEAPAVIAEDDRRIYVVGCYDGSSWLQAIEKDVTKYLDDTVEIPCIGGG